MLSFKLKKQTSKIVADTSFKAKKRHSVKVPPVAININSAGKTNFLSDGGNLGRSDFKHLNHSSKLFSN